MRMRGSGPDRRQAKNHQLEHKENPISKSFYFGGEEEEEEENKNESCLLRECVRTVTRMRAFNFSYNFFFCSLLVHVPLSTVHTHFIFTRDS